MKIAPIAMQLMSALPFVTDKFHDQVDISSINIDSSGLATVVTNGDHGVATGEGIVITGVKSCIKIDVAKTNAGIFSEEVTIWTTRQHNYVMGADNLKVLQYKPSKSTAYLSEFLNDTYNGEHLISSIPATGTKDKTVKSKMAFNIKFKSTPPLITAAEPLCWDGVEYGINGFHNITVVDSNTLTFQTDPSNADLVNRGNMVLHKKGRVTACINKNRIPDFYSRQNTGDLWCFVAETSDFVSKDRGVNGDATVMTSNETAYYLQLISNVGVYLVIPTSSSVTGAEQHDELEQAKVDVIASLAGFTPLNPYGNRQYMINYVGSNPVIDNRGYYIQSMQFEYQHEIRRENVYNNINMRSAKEMNIDMQSGKILANFWLQNDREINL